MFPSTIEKQSLIVLINHEICSTALQAFFTMGNSSWMRRRKTLTTAQIFYLRSFFSHIFMCQQSGFWLGVNIRGIKEANRTHLASDCWVCWCMTRTFLLASRFRSRREMENRFLNIFSSLVKHRAEGGGKADEAELWMSNFNVNYFNSFSLHILPNSSPTRNFPDKFTGRDRSKAIGNCCKFPINYPSRGRGERQWIMMVN